MNPKGVEHNASQDEKNEGAKKISLGSQGGKRDTARASSANRKENRASSRTRERDRYRQKGAKIIRNSYSGFVFNLSKVSTDDVLADQDPEARRASSRTRERNRYRQDGARIIRNSYSWSALNLSKVSTDDVLADQDLGARPKVMPAVTKNNNRSRRASVENVLYKYRKGPKMLQALKKETESSKHNKTQKDVFQGKSRHADNPPLKEKYSKDKSALQTATVESTSPIKVSETPKDFTGNDKKECEDERSLLQDNGSKNRQKEKYPSKEPLKNRNNSKENRPSKKHQAKITHLYVLLSDKATNSSDLKAFLEHRMGNPKALDFEMEENLKGKTDQNNPDLISLRFNSYNKASVAKHLLHVSNKHSSSKIRCFFEKEKADGQVVDKNKETKNKMETAFREIVETALNVSGKHEAKIKEVKSKLSVVEKAMGKRRGMSLFEFNKFSNEKLAFEDKLEELERQQKEFRNYMDGIKAKLTQLIDCEKFEKKLAEVRKDFGVECRRLEDALPMYARRADVLKIIKDNQVCVILGETGSGKSTQMAQYIFKAGVAAEGLIACTQPRKLAAINLATRVSSELASGVGHEVGYRVGMQSKMSAVTKVLFMTDHILLNECLHDELLTKYSCILIDEAHERSIYTDLLLGMLKKALNRRQDLKVVITSATIDPDVFVEYFGGINQCPVLRVSGRTFPVDIVWEQDAYFENSFPDDYESKALNKVIEIHQSEPIEEGDILVFLTSAVEIERCCEKMKKQVGETDLHCLQLHGKLKAEEQQLVFKTALPGKRKVVFATNSAETSITISGIKFVVDTGVVKEMRFDPKKNMNTLDVVSVSQSSANQRKGRAGRTSRGVCYRLYTTSDFNKMEKMSSPEILRIQVSQALLKLMELGVNPMSFDYVQSPSKEAMKSALCELTRIGAVDESGLTDLGKWIAKLPVEPVLGVFIKKGIDMEISSEAFVVASCCNESGIFFRVGTQEEKQMADMKKMKFCHKGGDLLTMLNVYREWEKIPEKSKGRWCQSNSINGKAMKNIRDMTNEIITSLNREIGIKVKHCFKNADDADSLVERLVFECMSSNLGYYLGHESAGYLVVNRLQRVQIHPSSAVMSLGCQPNWVVFNRILKTSADFMTEVTPVSSNLIDKAVEDGTIILNINNLDCQKVCCVLKVPVGKHVYWKLNYSVRRQIEEDISADCDNSLVVVEANKQRGEIYLFCLPAYKDLASAVLLSAIESVRLQLLFESREEFIGIDDSGVRAVLRRGGAAVDILMPNEYRSLNIKQNECSRIDLDEESLRKCFEVYGIVEQIWRPSGKKQFNSPFWGKVIFTDKQDAVTSLEHINKDTDSEITLVPITYQGQNTGSKQGYTMTVTWCRRPSKGHCFVYLDRPEDMALLLNSRPVINKATAVVSLSNDQSNLFVKGLMLDVTEDQVKEGLARELDLTHGYQNRFRVVIPRMNTIFRKNEWLEKQEALINLVSRYTRRESFKIKVLEYKEKTARVIAFVTFFESQICKDVTQQITSDNLAIDGHKIQVSMEFKTNVHINRKLYDMVVDDIENLIDLYKQRSSSTSLEIRPLKSGNVSLDIKAVSPEKLAKTKVRVDRIVGGDVLECGEKENLHALFCRNGKSQAKNIEKRTGTMVFLDERQMRVTIKGREKDRIRAVQMIEDFISKQIKSLEVEVRLKGEENPPGLLKALLVKYGTRFEELKKDTNISEIKLNLRRHVVTVTGTEESIKRALERIKDMRENITKRNEAAVVEVEMPDCPICLCPVEETDMYRLEYCGHAYCMICVTLQIQSAVSDKKMPVLCVAEDCNKPLVIRDISFQIRMGKIKKNEIVDAAVECLVAEKNKSFRYCITPNCEVVYRVTSNGIKFVCPVCHAKICTSCHTDFHDGLTCAMYKSAKQDDGSVEKWIRDKPDKRKMCPKCKLGIEKIDGCDHVTCRCGAHICWKCLKHFSKGPDCYGHMNEAHGSFV